jgi:RNA polymerase sigma-70 factor (ECF subfamily)
VLRRDERSAVSGPDLSGERGLRTAWDAHSGELFGYATHALGEAAAAEEAVQETFLRAWRSANRYDRSRPLRPWLFAILRNVVTDEMRARGARAVPAPRADRAPDEDDEFDRSLDVWLVEEALRRIRPEHRAVLVETYYRGRPYAEVAADLGIPEGTARSRAFYGLRALRLALEEMGWDG